MSLVERDGQVIWHPYTQMKSAPPPVGIVRGEGAYLMTEEGRLVLDAISSWWVNLHGHSHPQITARIIDQLQRLEHVIFAGFTHEGAVRLAERLLEHLPGQARVFYSDDGSTAVEVALKMAFQYWQQRGEPRGEIVALRGAYHGDTFGAMSVSERGPFTAPFAEHLFPTHFIDVPQRANLHDVAARLERVLDSRKVAAFIFEPLLQGVAGFQTYSSGALDTLLRVCRRTDTLTIADEVLTGFGRTGRMFASDYCAESPDIICLSKGLTGGTMALGATTCTAEVFEAFLDDDRRKSFFHGHSFTANPIACAAALASLDLLMEPGCQQRIDIISIEHIRFAERMRKHPLVRDARTLGTFLALELVTEGESCYFDSKGPELGQFFLEHNVLLRPLGNIIYVVPPYCVTRDELHKVYHVIEDALKWLTEEEDGE